MKIIGRSAERAQMVRELSDEQGLYLLEAVVEGKEPGETISYEYMRKGRFPNNNQASRTAIHRVYYQNGVPISGEDVAILDSSGQWVSD